MADWLQLKDVFGPLVSLGGAAVSTYFALRQSRYTKENFRIQLGSDILKWGNEAIELLSQSESLSHHKLDSDEDRTKFCSSRIDLLWRLSACIDKGRMYFPNVDESHFGLHKDKAYRGYRRPILDDLAYVYALAEKYKSANGISISDDGFRQEVNKCRRQFVSRLQDSVDPRRRIAFMEKEVKQPLLRAELGGVAK
jgi:hypothetical protein